MHKAKQPRAAQPYAAGRETATAEGLGRSGSSVRGRATRPRQEEGGRAAAGSNNDGTAKNVTLQQEGTSAGARGVAMMARGWPAVVRSVFILASETLRPCLPNVF